MICCWEDAVDATCLQADDANMYDQIMHVATNLSANFYRTLGVRYDTSCKSKHQLVVGARAAVGKAITSAKKAAAQAERERKKTGCGG